MMERPEKILALKFKFLGDVVAAVPALRALREHRPDAELHLLVAEDALPLVEHLPWVDRVWPLPRERGRFLLRRSLPVLKALRRERFTHSVDFVGNDRGAILSFLIGAQKRLGALPPGGFFGRRFCYHEAVPEAPYDQYEVLRDLHTLRPWNVPCPSSKSLEIHADPALAEKARTLIPAGAILCHLSTSQPKKEWPLSHWKEFHRSAKGGKHPVVFTSGPSRREKQLLEDFRLSAPDASILDSVPDLAHFLAVIQEAGCLVSGDTGPLHFAAGLGVPTVSMFAATSPLRWAPRGPKHAVLEGKACRCSGHAYVCTSARPCMASIPPESVWAAVQSRLLSE